MIRTMNDLTIYTLLILFGIIGLCLGVLILSFALWAGERLIERIQEEIEMWRMNDKDS